MMPSAQPRGLLKNFRRKSSGNALDFPQDSQQPQPQQQQQQQQQQQSSFRVLERPEKADARLRSSTVLLDRSSTLFPLQHQSKSADNLGTLLKSNHTTHSNSSGYYDTSGSSARHSSSSTLPSSLEADHDPDNADLHQARKQKILPLLSDPSPLDPPELPAPSFVARAGRAFSFGLKGKNSTTPPVAVPYTANEPGAPPSVMAPTRAPPPRPALEDISGNGFTAAPKPTYLKSSLGAPDFGGDFENMFDHMHARDQGLTALPQLPNTVRKVQSAHFTRPDSPIQQIAPSKPEPGTGFPERTSSRMDISPVIVEPEPEPEPEPTPEAEPTAEPLSSGDDRRFSWGSKRSSEELVSGDSSAFNSPSAELFPANAKPTMRGYSAVPNRQISPDPRDSPTSPIDYLTVKQQRRSTSSPVETAPKTPSRPAVSTNFNVITPQLVSSPQAVSPYGNGTLDSTPRPRKSVPVLDNAFPSESPTGPIKAINPVKQREAKDEKSQITTSDGPSVAGTDATRLTPSQAQKQDARLSIYHQQMQRVAAEAGDTLSELPSQAGRPGQLRTRLSNSSLPHVNLNAGSSTPAIEEEDEDEDIPLGILMAHGFPSKNRAPNHSVSAGPSYAQSAAGDGPSSLPAFARKLPQDPFAAGMQNRQSTAFGTPGPSTLHLPPSGPPGGLVGVIASEEVARAGRRGSPNMVTGAFNAPLPSNLQGQAPMPGYGRSMSMASLAGPQMAGGMAMDPYSPQAFGSMSPEQAAFNTQQQMAHLMQMQTQMMQQMMALQTQASQMGFQLPQTQGMGMQSPQTVNQAFGQSPGVAGPRPMSIMSGGRPPSMLGQGRSMTMLQPPTTWGKESQPQRSSTMFGQMGGPGGQYAGSVYGLNAGGPGAGYTPSIAPSERSNVGMPSRYRPVSTLDPVNQNTADRRSKTMTALSFNPHTMTAPMPARTPSPLTGQAAEDAAPAKPKSTIRIIDKIRGAPKSSLFRSNNKPASPEDDEDDAGWLQMAKKREAMRQKRASSKAQQNGGQEALADLYQGLDD